MAAEIIPFLNQWGVFAIYTIADKKEPAKRETLAGSVLSVRAAYDGIRPASTGKEKGRPVAGPP